ncbi:MAG TPA: dTDP-4-dehydrorhamnose 3,5-epimerase [Verrucomicrobiae bacterium]|nr:dTDP-4-dehydrorhamnose 3,5-epimerase [Verrucomicrobiae bacterium]
MKFIPIPLAGAYVVEMEPVADERGYFARFWCRDEFRAAGLNSNVEQSSLSFNRKRGTLRGMHYQAAPHEEVKLVRCTRGAIWDVLLDLRTGSSTFRRWIGVELTADNGKMVYVPAGFAHGFQTLTDEAEVQYQISEAYYAELTRGVRWNDPAFRIEWPLPNPILSARDREFPDFDVCAECRPAHSYHP